MWHFLDDQMGINFGVHCNRQHIVISKVNTLRLHVQESFLAHICTPLVTPVEQPEFNQTKIWPLPGTWLRRKRQWLFPGCCFGYGLRVPCSCASCVPWGTPRPLPSMVPCREKPQKGLKVPKMSPDVQKGSARAEVWGPCTAWESTPSPYLLGECVCGHFKPWCHLQHPWTASQAGSETHLLCVPFSAQRIASGLSHLLLLYQYFIPRKAKLFVFPDYNRAVVACFWAKMHSDKTYFGWLQQHKHGWFGKAMEGTPVHHCAGWSKGLQLL